jgi:predicted nucleic acid-binding protein
MLYLDSSALVKRYVQEEGSASVISRFESGEIIYTSVLSYAEIHAAIARKFRDKQLNIGEKEKLVDEFLNDWLFSLNVLELTTNTMSVLPILCQQYSLKASDAVHLSTAVWLKDTARIHVMDSGGVTSIVEFGVSDRRLAEAAFQCGFQVFNPAILEG